MLVESVVAGVLWDGFGPVGKGWNICRKWRLQFGGARQILIRRAEICRMRSVRRLSVKPNSPTWPAIHTFEICSPVSLPPWTSAKAPKYKADGDIKRGGETAPRCMIRAPRSTIASMAGLAGIPLSPEGLSPCGHSLRQAGDHFLSAIVLAAIVPSLPKSSRLRQKR
jgi:hypothetical protein